ncbi:sorbitol dehydrogenase [Lingula anatina]|uniref:Sorbitol dehydrogenase n=1 Tax=Lingula anatina TaxID=7574 RepID=A0A1S3JPW6_LINAN|nr:sorbitol dehydrogenase [Lingula anatina]|eukprot:XP_013412415.1 sorbitol dehydrogenase [Lingula anatina]
MTDTNLTAVLRTKGDLRLEETDIPQPKKGEVQLAIHSVGICGSDVKYWKDGAIGHFVVKKPMILGHETSGTVSALGEGVTNLKVGDRVAVEPGVPCRVCDLCKEGLYNLCPDVDFCATPPGHGSLRRYYCHAADFCYKLPDHVSQEEGALLEPFSVGLHACRRAGIQPGSSVLISGAGPIGLMSLVSAKAMGASDVCVTDISSARLEFAMAMGATHTLLIEQADRVEDLAVKVKERLGCMPSVTVECSGAESGLQLGIIATRPGGVVAAIGHGLSSVGIPLVLAVAKEIDIRGCFRYCNDYQLALKLVATGQVNIKPLITHRFTLGQTLDAFEMAKSGKAVKCMIRCARD